MINLYSTHCPKCKVIEKKLQQKGKEFNIIDDNDEVVKFGRDHNITSAPILEVDGDVYDFSGANRLLSQM